MMLCKFYKIQIATSAELQKYGFGKELKHQRQKGHQDTE